MFANHPVQTTTPLILLDICQIFLMCFPNSKRFSLTAYLSEILLKVFSRQRTCQVCSCCVCCCRTHADTRPVACVTCCEDTHGRTHTCVALFEGGKRSGMLPAPEIAPAGTKKRAAANRANSSGSREPGHAAKRRGEER